MISKGKFSKKIYLWIAKRTQLQEHPPRRSHGCQGQRQCDLSCCWHLAYQWESWLQIPSDANAWHVSVSIFGPSGKLRDVQDVKTFLSTGCMPLQIIQSCAYFSLYFGDMLWNEDLMWSTKTILNSIEDNALKFHVQVWLNGYKEKHCVRPLIFHIAWDCLLWHTNSGWFML